MNIPKRVKCLHCNEILNIDEKKNTKCSCGKITIVESTVVIGREGTDWVNISPVLLNEGK